jgi:hypothetical protein
MSNYIPLVKFDINEEMESSGIKAVSLVDEPAIESNFQYFNKERLQYIKLSQYEGVVAGLALIPDKPILRYDMEKKPYYGYFSTEVIKKLRNKFHKELMTNNVNTDHDQKNYIDAYLIESFIIDDEYKLQSVKEKGIEDAVLGSWFVAYKVEDKETFERVVNGELKGFSVEANLMTFYKVQNNNDNKLNTIMDKYKKFTEKFQQLLNEMIVDDKKEEQKFEIAKIKDSVDQIEYTLPDEPVNIILPDGSKKLAEMGEYVIEGDKVLVVKEAGLLAEIKPLEVKPEVEIEIEDSKKEEVVIEDSTKKEEKLQEDVVDPMIEIASLKEMIASKDAEILSMKDSLSSKDIEIAKLKEEIAKLKNEPLVDPASSELAKKQKEDLKFNKEQFSKLANWQQIAVKKGLYKIEDFIKSKK